MPINELVYLFRTLQESRPIFLLGAGASFRSGIPTAAEAVKRIAKAAYAKNVKGMDWRVCQVPLSDWTSYLHNQPWFLSDESRLAENFPLAVEELLLPKEFRRRFFEDMIIPPNGINEGYKHLAEIIQRGLCWTILTGNFDHLIVEGLRTLQPHLHDVIEINRTADDLVRFNINNRRQVVYLHGSVEYYRDKNLINETKKLDDSLVKRLRPLLAGSPLIVVGYRGYEPSIMEHLLEGGIRESGKYPHGIYWCLKRGDTLHENVQRLEKLIHPNLRVIEIDGFDELMGDLNQELHDEAFYVSGSSVSTPNAALNMSAPMPFERQTMEGVSIDDLDRDLILSTLATYCKRIKIPIIDQTNYVSFLREQGLIVQTNGKPIPTVGCYLLFGRETSERFPYARVSFTRGHKKRVVFEGNLITQYRKLVEYLGSSEVNPLLRVKERRSSEERTAYPERALTELTVNLLVHRDYATEEYGRIEHLPGQLLKFTNPGGLLEKVRKRVAIKEDGKFKPVRSVTGLRNELLADIFFGLGPMDKAGSGLADVQDLMLENGGQAEFAIIKDNDGICATLFQPLQSSPASSQVARARSTTETYITNLLPFSMLPRAVSVLPLREKPLIATPLFDKDERPSEFPIFIEHDDKMFSFADLRNFEEFCHRRGFLDKLKRLPLRDFLAEVDNRNLFVWLLNKHWSFFLRRWVEKGLTIEPKRKRAYFALLEGEKNRIFYDSRARKNVRRDVVKRRERARFVEHENEGIYYAVVEFAEFWALQIKPFYMFTRADGVTPIPSFLMAQRATKRYRFDRNKNVDDDLSFWARYLSNSQPSCNIGGVGVDDLILDFEYCAAEVAIAKREIDDENKH
jgi:predicted HTH transcriptional regulator